MRLNILGMAGQFLTMLRSPLMKSTHLVGSRSNFSSWVVWWRSVSNGNRWTSSSHVTFLLPESALDDTQLMLDTVFILSMWSLQIGFSYFCPLQSAPRICAITTSLSQRMIMAKTQYHDPFRIFHFESQESVLEVRKMEQ